MRNLVIWSVAVFATAETAFSEEPKQPPKELTVTWATASSWRWC